MIRFLFSLLYFVLWLFDACLLVYVVLSWLHPASNRWTELVRRVVEPVLSPIRRLLVQKLPSQWQMLDWSPLAAYLCVGIIRRLLLGLQYAIL